MTRLHTQKLFVTFLILLFSFPSLGQTGRYWSNSFNTDASLLSGAVVGGGSGIAAIFYNPSQIADIDYKKFSISANIFSTYIYRYDDALGGGQDYSDWDFKVQPRFVAFLLRPKNWTKTSIELASFTRDNVYSEIRNRTTQQINVIKSLPGNEEYIGDFYYRMEYEDYWLGIGMAKKYSEKFSFGLSAFHSYAVINYDYNIETKAYNLESGGIGNSEDFYIARFKNVQNIKGYTSRFVFKMGFKYSVKNLNLGLNITTPTLAYAGTSKVYREVSVQNINSNLGLPLPNMLATEQQDELETRFKEPLSIAFGATYFRKKSSLYFTAEYFAPIKRYNLITDQPPSAFVTNNIIGFRTENWLDYKAQHRDVTNVAIGMRGSVNENIEVIGGFRTDFTFTPYTGGGDNKYPAEITTFSLDQYHVTGGAQFKIFKTDIIAGLQYSFARGNNLKQVANFSNPVEFYPEDRIVLQGQRDNSMEIRENTLSLFLGFTYNIGQPSE
ncbi:hypothetical protein [Flammeovirga aprica]|uniref:Uncharacterized protein n=1 Tax=Flammeovirga aprica JL-4 TaxID=694437 RepID=A0A7X9P2Y2_9BACT|nr:hypothetical protein [Flammeovirga aprica]NME68360.1 hypothetical protein [Flammeovirga aprica JL-4]